MNIETKVNRKAINEIMKDLLTQDQIDEVMEFVGDCVKDAIKQKLEASEVVDRIRDELSYNQLLFLSTMYIGNHIVDTLEEFQNTVKKTLEDL
tara:strand:+ start:347 stop:625 length:279 start_codon:yes stop_codon:yes gene_type:complete